MFDCIIAYTSSPCSKFPCTQLQGLQELYHYLQEHPSVDLATDILQPLNMTRYFESYIARGVKRVEIELAPEKGGPLALLCHCSV